MGLAGLASLQRRRAGALPLTVRRGSSPIGGGTPSNRHNPAVRSDLLTPPFRRVFLANFFSDLSFALLVHFPGFLSALGAGEALIGLVVGVSVAVSVAARPGMGQLMDRIGRIPVIRVAGLIRVLAMLGFLAIDHIGPGVFVLRAVYGLSLAVMFTGYFTYAADLIPAHRRTQGMAVFGLSGMIPGMFGAALGDLVVARAGFTGLFLVVAALDLVTLAVAATLRPLPAAPSLKERPRILTLARVEALRPVWLLTLAFGLAFGSLLTFMRTFVDATGVGSVGLFFACYSTVAVLLRLAFSWLPDRAGYPRVLYPALAATVAGVGMLAVTDSAGELATAALLAGTGHAFVFPILSRLIVERSPAENRGAAMGLYTAAFDLAILAGGPLLGLVIELAGYPTMFTLLALLVALGAGGFARLDRRTGRVVPPRQPTTV